MRIVVFCGPSLPGAEVAAALPTAEQRGPAAQGDVLRAVLDGADRIGLIDGYFETRPAVWHKEILFAMTRGLTVFGAASMGALRAAELHSFGMVGIGRIFAAFRDNILTDDDEVAVTHGPEALGYPSLSVAMVDLRERLSKWVESGELNPQEHEAMVAQQKALHFSQRGYDTLAAAFPAYRELLLTGGPMGSQKKDDARNLLLRIASSVDPDRSSTPFTFEETYHWLALKRSVEERRRSRDRL